MLSVVCHLLRLLHLLRWHALLPLEPAAHGRQERLWHAQMDLPVFIQPEGQQPGVRAPPPAVHPAAHCEFTRIWFILTNCVPYLSFVPHQDHIDLWLGTKHDVIGNSVGVLYMAKAKVPNMQYANVAISPNLWRNVSLWLFYYIWVCICTDRSMDWYSHTAYCVCVILATYTHLLPGAQRCSAQMWQLHGPNWKGLLGRECWQNCQCKFHSIRSPLKHSPIGVLLEINCLNYINTVHYY